MSSSSSSAAATIPRRPAATAAAPTAPKSPKPSMSASASTMAPASAASPDSLLTSLLMVGLAALASRMVMIPPDVAETTIFLGIGLDKWVRSLESLLWLYGGWQLGAVVLLAGLAQLSRLTHTAADDAVLELVSDYLRGSMGGPRLALLYLGLYVASLPLDLPVAHPSVSIWMEKGLIIVVGLWALCLLWDLVQLLLLRAWRDDRHHRLDPTLVSALGFARPIAIFAGLLALLSRVGVEVSSVIAGFGVGGLAVALSTQTVLQDLSAGLALLVDRPFEVGDFVGTGGFKGVVTSIGLKSTTLTALSGEVLVACNGNLANDKVSKFPQVCDRLKTFTVSLDPATPENTLRGLPGLITKRLQALEAQEEWSGRLTPGFVGVTELTGWAIMLEINYTFHESRLREFKNLHAAVLLSVLELLRLQGVNIAAPPEL